MLRYAVGFSGLIVACLVTPAQAKLAGCYVRVYTAAELGRHPDMTIAAIQLDLKKIDGDPTASGEVAGRFRGEKDLVGSPIYCKSSHGVLSCNVEGDGGNFKITEIPKGARIDSDGFSFDDEHSFASASEKVLHLKAAPAADCK
jgi:hypothetical protein